MGLVLDASITLAWVFQEVEPAASEAQERLRREEAVVPSLWWFEVRNGLVMSERRGLLTEQRTGRFLRDLSRTATIVDGIPDEVAVLTLARRRRLTAYDAAYLELAQRRGLPLATLDGALASAARAEGVSLVGHSTG
jgi:predicted nucleic acid-binding protein